jgi:hypothetical protein
MLAATGNPATEVTLPATLSSNDTLTGQEALIEKLKSKFFSGQRAPKPYLTEQGILAEQLKTGEVGSFGPPSPGADMDREALLERIAGRSPNERIPPTCYRQFPAVRYARKCSTMTSDVATHLSRCSKVCVRIPLRRIAECRSSPHGWRLKMRSRSALMETPWALLHHVLPHCRQWALCRWEKWTVIQVDEYGWTRTVVLQLTSRGGNPSKSLGANSLWGRRAHRRPE